jgi:uncharacterized membrane protein YjfL (UPF0719 family)
MRITQGPFPHLLHNLSLPVQREFPYHDATGETVDVTNYLVSIVISLVVGLIGFVAAYKLFDWLTPGVNFSDQLNADNRSVAIFLAGLFVGLGLLLGNAIK